MKKILIGDTVLGHLLAGIKTLDPMVAALYGPDKSNVISRIHNVPAITNFFSGLIDSLDLADPFEDTGMLLMKDVVREVRNAAGSGAGISAILALSLLTEGNKLITAGVPRHTIIKRLRELVAAFDTFVADRATRLKAVTAGREREVYRGVAWTATGDTAISDLMADMFMHVGAAGNVELKRGGGFSTKVEYIDGFSFKTTPLSYKFLGSEKRMELQHPYVLVSSGIIPLSQGLVDVLIKCNKESRPLIVVSEGLSRDALELLVHNVQVGSLKAMAVKPPAYGGDKFVACRDLAQASKATVVCEEERVAVSPSCLGYADSAIITSAVCSLSYAKSNITEEYLAPIRKLEAEENRLIFKKHLKERIGNLQGKSAIITVGGATESARELNYYHAEFAAHAVRGAMTEGAIPGGCQVFYDFYRQLPPSEFTNLAKAFSAPFTLLYRSRTQACSITEFLATDEASAYDMQAGAVRNMLDSGLIDSAKVIKAAAAAAVSTALTVISTGAIIREE